MREHRVPTCWRFCRVVPQQQMPTVLCSLIVTLCGAASAVGVSRSNWLHRDGFTVFTSTCGSIHWQMTDHLSPPPTPRPPSAPPSPIPCTYGWYRRSAAGAPVDWFIVIKKVGSNGYMYMDNHMGNFRVSGHSLSSNTSGAVARTINAAMAGSFLFFNAHSPPGGKLRIEPQTEVPRLCFVSCTARIMHSGCQCRSGGSGGGGSRASSSDSESSPRAHVRPWTTNSTMITTSLSTSCSHSVLVTWNFEVIASVVSCTWALTDADRPPTARFCVLPLSWGHWS